MSENILQASLRLEKGKGACRKIRANEKLPAVLYAKGQDTKSILVCPRATRKLLLSAMGINSLIKLNLSDESSKKSQEKMVMIKDRQIDKIKRDLVHVDFVEVDVNKEVAVSVPVVLSGKSEAVTMGGKLDHVLHKMRVKAKPGNIPENINIDISKLSYGSTHAEDVPLPAGLTINEKPRVVVLTIKKPKNLAKEEEAEGAKPAAQAKK